MGHDYTKISIDDGIKRAQAGTMVSWSHGLIQRIMPDRVVRAELRDDDVVVLYYHNPGPLGGRPGRPYSEFDDLWQEFESAPSAASRAQGPASKRHTEQRPRLTR